MAPSGQSVNLIGFFTDLSKAEQAGDFEKAHKICNKILAQDQSNLKAKQCKVVCKIQLDQFQDALKEINKPVNSELKQIMLFEKAYCEYKLNNIDESLKTLSSIENFGFREKELQAQALYRKEQYEKCYEIYVDLIRNSDDDYEDERTTNLIASVAGLSSSKNECVQNIPDLPENTFEQLYNKACLLLGKSNVNGALEKLQKSEDVCKKTMDEEGATEEEIEAELNLIQAQIAYAYLCLNKNEEALNIYNRILKQKPTDSAVLSVINNNVVAINQEANIFDSKKRLKIAVTEMQNAKLLSLQRKSIMFNNILLHLQTNQYSICNDLLNEFEQLFSNENSLQNFLVKVSLLKKEKKLDEAKRLLEQSLSTIDLNSDEALELMFFYAQLLFEQKDIQGLTGLLSTYKRLSQHMGLVSAVVATQLSLQKKKEALKTLENVIQYHQEFNNLSKHISFLYREATKLMLELNQDENAITLLEELRKLEPSNFKIMAQLVNAYSKVNPDKAQEIAKDLPSLEDFITDIDTNAIESGNWSAGTKYIKKGVKDASDKSPKSGETEQKKDKKKRKRKSKLPKNYDSSTTPDPERWLPKWQRSTYRKRKNDRKHNVGKGTQGAVGGPDSNIENIVKQSPRPVGNSPMQGLTRQQRAQKKKKGGRR